jgi:uroporphyrinogen decarboxylase
MTNRERIVRTLLCEPTDRVPFGVNLGFYPWGQTLERWRKESGISDLNPGAYFGYDTGFHVVPAEYGPFPHVETKVLEENDRFVISRDYRGIVMRNRRDHHSMPEWLSHPIRNEQDWLAYKEKHLQPRTAERLARLDSFIESVKNQDAPIQLGCFPWGVFGTARDMMGAEELLIGFYDVPDLVRDIMQTFVDQWVTIFEAVAKRIRIDHIHIWEDMSGRQGSLISMRMVEEFMMPHYDRIVAFARQHGIPIVSVDSDGLVDALVPKMMEHGINMYLPFEVQAGNDIERYRALYPKLGIVCGLDKNALARTRKEINLELARAERMVANGGYIPGCDHLIPPNVPWDNWKYFNEELRKICGA